MARAARCCRYVVNVILDPTGGAARVREDVVLASPRARLRGATIGLLENTKQNASLFLDELGKLLVERYGVTAVVPRTKLAFALPMPDELLEELAGACQAVVVGVGDCGSCSGSAVADGVALERRGIPAAVICTDAFTVTADAMAALKGAKGYEYAMTAHPVAVLTPEEVRERAEQALPRVVALLTTALARAGGVWTEESSDEGASDEGRRRVGRPGPVRAEASTSITAIEYCYDQGWSDGLPVVPASRPLVDAFLAQTSRSPDEVIGRNQQVDREVTVELAAINAAMAGCRPEYFPVVLAAWEALVADRAAGGGGWQSTSGPAPLIVVNGPIRDQLGFNCGVGVFGPGFRPNATVARAIGLIVRNAYGIRPQVLEQATQGLPGRWSICVGENEQESPWPPLAVEAGLPEDTSAVSAMLLRTCEFVDNRHTQDPEQILWDFADTISRTGSLIFRDTSAGVVFGPEHANLLAKAGYSRSDVQRWFVEHCGRTRADLRRAGKNGVGDNHVRFAAGTDDTDGEDHLFERIIPSPQHVPVIVAGSRNAAMSMVVRVFGVWSGRAIPVEVA